MAFLGCSEPQGVAAASLLGVPMWWSGGAVATLARGPVYRLGGVAWGLKRLKNMKLILARKRLDFRKLILVRKRVDYRKLLEVGWMISLMHSAKWSPNP